MIVLAALTLFAASSLLVFGTSALYLRFAPEQTVTEAEAAIYRC